MAHPTGSSVLGKQTSTLVAFADVWERVRHIVPTDAQMIDYPEKEGGGRWTWSLCRRAAWEATGGDRTAVLDWPLCAECKSLDLKAAS